MKITNFKKSAFVLGGSLLLNLAAQAEIRFDREAEPLPLVDLKVVLPVGFELTSKSVPGAGNLLGDILESGTAKRDRTEFLEKLAEFGASLSFSVGNDYSQWDLSFPIVEGKNYDELIGVLKENWQEPRWTDEVFNISKVKLEAAIKGGLDRDNSLAISTTRRWINKYEFGGRPLFIDDLGAIKKDAVKSVYEKEFLGVKDIWAGAIAPDSSEPLIKKILAEVFSRQGGIKVGATLKKLPAAKYETRNPSSSKTILLIDKEQRAQAVTSLMSVDKDELDTKNELPFFFGGHIYFESGLASVFADEIRGKRGLAYSVGSSGNSFHDHPVISLVMNPVKERIDEALQATSGLLKDSFVTGTLLEKYPVESWNRQWQSFRYGRVLTRGTPGGRLGERLAVVTGEVTADFYKSDVNKWKIDLKDVNRVYKDIWKNGAFVMAIVGSAKDLRPLVEKYFPGSKIRVINYRDTIQAKAYPDKLD